MALLGICLILVILHGLLDYFTGRLPDAIFYVIPVLIAAWYSGWRLGVIVSATSAIMWLVSYYTTSHVHHHWIVPVSNAALRFGLLAFISYLLADLATHLRAEAKLARIDALTGAMNRRAFDEASCRFLELAARHRHQTTLAYIDLDNFKEINDRYGHSEGDRVLRSVATALRQTVRASDVVGRVGGDEFALLLAETDYQGAQQCLGNVRERLQQVCANDEWPATCSIGAATFPTPPATVAEAIDITDHLMYRAKEVGKNGIVHEIVNVQAL